MNAANAAPYIACREDERLSVCANMCILCRATPFVDACRRDILARHGLTDELYARYMNDPASLCDVNAVVRVTDVPHSLAAHIGAFLFTERLTLGILLRAISKPAFVNGYVMLVIMELDKETKPPQELPPIAERTAGFSLMDPVKRAESEAVSQLIANIMNGMNPPTAGAPMGAQATIPKPEPPVSPQFRARMALVLLKQLSQSAAFTHTAQTDAAFRLLAEALKSHLTVTGVDRRTVGDKVIDYLIANQLTYFRTSVPGATMKDIFPPIKDTPVPESLLKRTVIGLLCQAQVLTTMMPRKPEVIRAFNNLYDALQTPTVTLPAAMPAAVPGVNLPTAAPAAATAAAPAVVVPPAVVPGPAPVPAAPAVAMPAAAGNPFVQANQMMMAVHVPPPPPLPAAPEPRYHLRDRGNKRPYSDDVEENDGEICENVVPLMKGRLMRENKRYKCAAEDCDYAHFKSREVVSHVWHVHLGGRHRCPDCLTDHKDYPALKAHRADAHGARKFTCDICREDMDTYYNYLGHLCAGKMTRLYSHRHCPHPDCREYNENGLKKRREHFVAAHNPEDPVACPACDCACPSYEAFCDHEKWCEALI